MKLLLSLLLLSSVIVEPEPHKVKAAYPEFYLDCNSEWNKMDDYFLCEFCCDYSCDGEGELILTESDFTWAEIK